MEDVIKSHTYETKSPQTTLTIHKESHAISKFKPKIRIVHIFAPEIIKTDVANFRELVQRLTGKPEAPKGGKKKAKKKTTCSSSDASESSYSKTAGVIEFESGYRNFGFGERVKEEEEEIWGGMNSSFFSGLGDLDGFLQGLTEFPLVPMNSSHMEVFGEAQLLRK
ncbi:VQ motif-containing protein 25-like [Tasmannia lanceolata]|uniref:VQ motif-containing protein 25-like n=1 Tax=Tasmannia lanceolata TaxID=3420 RepID=UPI004062EDD2